MPNTNMRDEYGGMLWYDGAWSVIMKQHKAQAKTQYQNVKFSMDDMYYVLISYDGTWSSQKQHMTLAKTQYQYVEFSMDDSDWFDMMVHGHHETSSDPCQDPIPICRI